MRRCEPAWLNIACIAPSYQVRKHISKSMYFDIDILALKEMNGNQRTKQNLMHNLLDFDENFMHYIKIRKFIQIKLFIFCQRKLIDMRKLPVLFIDGVQRLLFATKVLFLQSALSLSRQPE